MEQLKRALVGRLWSYPQNIELGWKGLPGTKHSSLLRKSVNYGHKKFKSPSFFLKIIAIVKAF